MILSLASLEWRGSETGMKSVSGKERQSKAGLRYTRRVHTYMLTQLLAVPLR